jgi:hypothetical protein
MTRREAEAAIQKLVPRARLKLRHQGDEVAVFAYAPSRAAWSAVAASESAAWHSLAAQVERHFQGRKNP